MMMMMMMGRKKKEKNRKICIHLQLTESPPIDLLHNIILYLIASISCHLRSLKDLDKDDKRNLNNFNKYPNLLSIKNVEGRAFSSNCG